MRKAESPYLADLFAISLRWLALFGLTISLGAGGYLTPRAGQLPISITLVVLSLPVLWNGFVTALAILNRRLIWHRQINVALDLVFSIALFISARGLRGGVSWVALLPLFSGAIYFETIGALLVGLLMSLFQTAYTYLDLAQHLPLGPLGIMTGFNIITGAGVAMLSKPLLSSLRRSYQGTVTRRKESEHKVQRQEHDRMRALFSMIETFSATLNYQTVLDTVLNTAVAALGGQQENAEGMVGAVLLFGEDQKLEIRSAFGFSVRDQGINLPAQEGALMQTLQQGEAHLVELPNQDPELGRLLALQDCKAALCLPLLRGMNAYGLMLFAHADPAYFNANRVETLQMLSNQAVIAIQNARLYQDLAKENERIVQSQEEAQKKLARDLHDGPTQSLSAIAMRINIARRLMEQSPQEASEELQRIEDMARRTTQEIRHMLFTLRPLVLETEGLKAALQAMADKMNDLYQQNVMIDADPEVIDRLDAPRQTVVFYLAEEAVNNARKHAEASMIHVNLHLVPRQTNMALLEIADNGAGFDVPSVMGNYDRRGSLGMINLRERSELINGLLRIDSVPGKGTCIRILIPFDEAAADLLQRHRQQEA